MALKARTKRSWCQIYTKHEFMNYVVTSYWIGSNAVWWWTIDENLMYTLKNIGVGIFLKAMIEFEWFNVIIRYYFCI